MLLLAEIWLLGSQRWRYFWSWSDELCVFNCF